MKAVLISDFHLDHKPLTRFKWNDEFIQSLLEKYSQDHALFLLGDVVEVSNHIDSSVINQVMHLCLSWARYNRVVIIAGQHCSFKQGHSSFRALEDAKNIIVVDDKEFNLPNSNIWFVPFFRENNKTKRFDYYRQMLDNVPDNSIVMTHVTLREALADNWTEDKDMVELQEFKRFKQTFAGDIHSGKEWTRKDGANFVYCGIPSQRNFSDANASTSYILFDTDKYTKVYTDAPRFLNVDTPQDIPQDGIQYVIRIKNNNEIDLSGVDNVLQVEEVDISNKQLREQLHVSVIGDDVYKIYVEQRNDTEKFGSAEALLGYLHELKQTSM